MKKIILLVLVFVIALSGYFVFSRKNAEKKNDIIYTTIDEPNLPVIWIDTCDRTMNVMRGYTCDVVTDIAYDTLTILPESLNLPVHIEELSSNMTGLSYEIRSADLKNLIENNTVLNYTLREDGADAVLPIQNLITPGEEYRLDICVTTQSEGSVHYYTRLATDEKNQAAAMISIADDFSVKNFDYEKARDNTVYLETDLSGDNSTLAQVNLKSSFNQLTYQNMGLIIQGIRDVRLCEYDGNTGSVYIHFMAGRQATTGEQELYEISESFVMRVGPERIYMMNYNRSMHQVFTAGASQFTEKRVVLGVTDAESVEAIRSSEGKKAVFVSDKDMWWIDSDTDRCVKVYSFRSEADTGIRSNFEKHNIKLLSCEDDGSAEFMVYGYMSRGRHEGKLGICLMKFNAKDQSLVEQYFIPQTRSYEEIDADIRSLAYLGSGSMLYLKLAGGIYGIDITSGEIISVAENLGDNTYSISTGKNCIAWQDTSDRYGSPMLHYMNLDTGRKQEISAGNDELLKPLGFISMDLITGTSNVADVWNINGIDRSIPFYAIDILDGNLTKLKHYTKEGQYISGVSVEDSRIHVTLYTKTSGSSFYKAGEDTIVNNTELGSDLDPGVGYYAAQTLGTTFYFEPSGSKSIQNMSLSTPDAISYDTSEMIKISEDSYLAKKHYYAYASGKLVGVCENIPDAVKTAYAGMGIVRSESKLLYCRAATTSLRTLKNPESFAEELISKRESGENTDLFGISLQQAFYFVSQGMPVLAWSDGGDALILYAYDKNSVSLYKIASGERIKQTVSEASAMFDNGHNDFSCIYRIEK